MSHLNTAVDAIVIAIRHYNTAGDGSISQNYYRDVNLSHSTLTDGSSPVMTIAARARQEVLGRLQMVEAEYIRKVVDSRGKTI